MKAIILSLLLFVFTMGKAVAQTITGNKVSRDFPVASFDAIKANGVVELTLVQGTKESVTVEGDEGLQAFITIANNGNTLEIDTKKLSNKKLKGDWKLAVTVYFRNLNDVSLSTVGNVRNEGTLKLDDVKLRISSVGNTNLKLEAQKFRLDASSVGNIELAGSAKDAVLRNSSIGNIKAVDFAVSKMDIDNSGIGNTEVNAAEITGFHSSTLGSVRNRGQKVKNWD
ncbi:head GIN domain-containing protein [Paracnuella aquatica]|uniref:head GIN domain-containing protein n=1 Tax=Paracnuella aquatica TaxID=2268757 RepID=UPI000DEFC3C6|nr:head GIN domain-containing protein [Paracnuella aquatica]RPD50911.1 DUF2807 domain-containing protein [Paracnuella aquatica]